MEFLLNLIRALNSNEMPPTLKVTWSDTNGSEGFYIVPMHATAFNASQVAAAVGAGLAAASGISSVTVHAVTDSETQTYP